MPLIYIVPEQFSLTAEYDAADVINKAGLLDVEVLTFKRLCHRVYNEFGYKKNQISKASKVMLLYTIMKNLEKELILLRGVDRKVGLVTMVCDLISEFKRYNVSPDDLLNLDTDNIRLSNKLHELAFIYSEYNKRFGNEFNDSDDDLKIVLNYLKDSKIVSGAKIWIDGFDGFTPQELEIIKVLNKVSDVTIAISADREGSELFLLNKKTLEKLKKFANVEEAYLDEIKRFESNELLHLEKNFDSFPIVPYASDNATSSIDITVSSNLYNEVENIACDVLRKVRDENFRYENILIATRNLETYEPIFKMIFDRYNIPYFIDNKTSLSLQPLVSLVMSLLDILSKNFTSENVISYLKTGLTNIDDINDIDIMENYVLKYGINRSKWLEEWKYDDADINEKINSIRLRIITPILNLKSKLSSKKKVKEMVVSIYEFLNEIDVQDRIQSLINEIKDDDEAMSTEVMFANTYVQVWNVFIKLLDEMYMVLGDDDTTFDKFQNILRQGIAEEKIGLIPTSKDRLIIGDIARSKNSHIDILYVVGVNDGLFPMQYDDEGFLNDSERNRMLDAGLEIAKDTKMMLLEENFNIYKILTTPKKELHISYPIADDAGSVLRPSSIINTLKKLFPKIKEINTVTEEKSIENLINTANSSFVHLANEYRKIRKNEPIAKEWKALYSWYEKNNPSFISLIESGVAFKNKIGKVSRENAKSLYGSTMESSVSRMETYASCPFMFYLKYGLNLKERKVYKLELPDVGIFLHDILDKFNKYLEKNGMSFRDIEQDELNSIASTIVDETLNDYKYNIFTSSNKLKFLSIKLKRVVKRVLWIIALQLKSSDFEVAGSEINFGKEEKYPAIQIELADGNKLLLNGKIDRLDVAKTEDGNYIRVIDYKSSGKEINLSDVYYGIRLQLITYLDVVSNKDNIPGGALYLKLDDPIIKSKKDMSKEEIEDAIRKKLRMTGVILADVKLVKAMDRDMEKESNNLNLSLKNDGTYAKMPTVSEGELKDLIKHTKLLLKKFADEILAGNVDNTPIKQNGRTPCSYCEYKAICSFDKELGNSFKKVKELKKEEVFEQLRMF